LIKIEKQDKYKKYNDKMSNEEQISDILYPALEKFLDYIKNYRIKGTFLMPYYLTIPRLVNVDTILKESRKTSILKRAEEKNLVEDELIEEFIQSLGVIKSRFRSPSSEPALSSFSESAPNSLPELEPPPPPPPPPPHFLPEPVRLPPPNFPNPQRESSNKSITPSRSLSRSSSRSSSISSYKDVLTSPSISSYESPSTSSYKSAQTSPKAIRKTSYSYLKDRLGSIRSLSYFKRPFGSKKGKPKLVAIHGGGGKNYKTRNKVYSSQKKTRRHKTRRHKNRNI
jgi:hypothetical protein